MKKITIAFLLLSVLNSWSQNNSKEWLQKNKYNLALSYFQKNEFEKAIDPFLFAYKLNPESETGKISKNKIDSIIPIIRENLVKKITGTWILVGNQPIWSQHDLKVPKLNDTLMIITKDEIAYYIKNIKTKETTLLKTEKMEFYNGFGNNNSVTEMINSDQELWTYIVDESSNYLRIIHTGNETVSGRNTVDLDNKEIYYIRNK